MNSNLVQISNLHVERGGIVILRGVTAGIARGRITALIGLNGSGKTTLLRTILKEIPYTGRIVFHCGHDHNKPHPEHIGYVPQKLNVDAQLPLTVCDLMALALQRLPPFFGVRRRTMEIIKRQLDLVGAQPAILERPVEKLSGGELQRVLLALALEPQPELLLLDEPAAGIDFQSGEQFYELLARLNATMGVTILLVSHDLTVVSKHAHHVLCLKDGRIQCEGSPQEIVTDQVLAETFGTVGPYTHAHRHG